MIAGNLQFISRALYGACTLYMLCILLRWWGPWLELELESPRLRWICRITDPLLTRIRSILPLMGPWDFAPVAALFAVWLLREFSMLLTAGPSLVR